MRKYVENIFWFLIENGPTILTIGFSGYVIALAQTTTISTDVMLSWILGLLGLIATSQLVERLRKLNHLESISTETLKTIQSKFGERASADDFFTKRLPSIELYLEKAFDIHLSGVVLQRTIRENIGVLARRLKDGANIKVIIINPNSMVVEKLINPGTNLTKEYLQANCHITMQNIKWLSELPDSKGTIELRLMDELPHFNIIAFDTNKDYGSIFIEFFPQRWVHGSRPRMELNPNRDEYWFKYFKEQFDKLWQDCEPISLDNLKQ